MKNIILVGNPNSGKTTLYNKITQSNEHIGNYSGVTVDITEKIIIKNNDNYNIIDLPGIYSLTPNSLEEQVACKYLYKAKDNKDVLVLNICDAKSLKRSLVLTLELLEAGFKVLMVINSIDKQTIDNETIKRIQNTLGINVIQLNLKKQKSFNEIFIINNYKNVNKLNYYKKYEMESCEKFIIIKMCEKDVFITPNYSINETNLKQIKKFIRDRNLSLDTILNDRLNIINSIVKTTNIKCDSKSVLDNILLNKYMAFPIFLAIILLVFYITFSSFGAYISNVLDYIISVKIYNTISNLLTSVGTNEIFNSFILNGLINGVGMLVCFIPQIVLLFIFISILENSGYLPRLAFLLDDVFEKFGLSGKSLFTFVMSFGCNTTAMLTAKNLNNTKSKIKTMILSQYMSCSAKLPIFTTLCVAFFGGNVLMIFCAYLIGILIALILALIFQNSKFSTQNSDFILEMPTYLGINIKHIIYVAYKNSKEFLLRVGGIVLLCMCIIWLLQNFSINLKYTTEKSNSILYLLGNILAPIFTPLGFGSYGVAIALITGVMAKEIVVSTFSMLNFSEVNTISLTASLALPTSVVNFSTASALSFMVFVLLYLPCISSMSVMKKELGTKNLLIALLIQFIIAYILSLITFTIASFFNSIIITILAIFIILTSILIICMKNDKCNNCNKCSCIVCNKVAKN